MPTRSATKRTYAILICSGLLFVATGYCDETNSDDRDKAETFAWTVPPGMPRFAFVAKVGVGGQRVSLGLRNAEPAGNIQPSMPEIEARAYTIGGQQMHPNELPKRLRSSHIALITTDGKPPSREYREHLRPTTIVFVIDDGNLTSPLEQLYAIRLKIVAEAINSKRSEE